MRQNRILVVLAVAIGLLATASAVLASTSATIRGNARANTIRGTAAADSIWGLGGNDRLYGGAGNDKLYGGAGNDLLVGGPGADVLSCGAGNDKAVGGPGDKATGCEHVSGIPKPGGGGDDGGGGGSNPPPPAAACSNGTDDDGDGKADFPNDPGCESASDTDETDPAAPVTAGSYKGATSEGNFVFFTVTADRRITAFRANDVSETCEPQGGIGGSVNWGNLIFPIGNDGSFTAQNTWTGSEVNGDTEWTSEYWNVSGHFDTATNVTGTVTFNDELNYKGAHYRCASGAVKWTATLQS
jgi:Ca2+-binding RTX toxin-like protein